MELAAYPTPQRKNRSRIDLLADRAPRAIRPQAGAAALAADKLVTASMRAQTAVKTRPLPYALTALAIGAGIGLIAFGPSRRAIGSALGKAGHSSVHALGRQLGKELRSFFR